jgi:hypothetical protein
MVGVKELFANTSAPPSAGQIIGWWERRRLHYNLLVFATFVVVMIGKRMLLMLPSLRGHFWGASSYMNVVDGFFVSLLPVLLLVQIPANIWYTGGWIVELLLTKGLHLPARRFGPWALGFGMAFSALFAGVLALYIF